MPTPVTCSGTGAAQGQLHVMGIPGGSGIAAVGLAGAWVDAWLQVQDVNLRSPLSTPLLCRADSAFWCHLVFRVLRAGMHARLRIPDLQDIPRLGATHVDGPSQDVHAIAVTWQRTNISKPLWFCSMQDVAAGACHVHQGKPAGDNCNEQAAWLCT